MNTSKLQVVFDLNARLLNDQMRVAPPYDWLPSFIMSEMGRDLHTCKFWLEKLRGALAGTPALDLDGNMYELNADATTTTISNLYNESAVRTFPTGIVHEAIERWVQFLEAHGLDAAVKVTRPGEG